MGESLSAKPQPGKKPFVQPYRKSFRESNPGQGMGDGQNEWSKELPDIQTTRSRHAVRGRSTDSNIINDYIVLY